MMWATMLHKIILAAAVSFGAHGALHGVSAPGFRPGSTFGDGMVLAVTGGTPPIIQGSGSIAGTTIMLTLSKTVGGSSPLKFTATAGPGPDFRWAVHITPAPPTGNILYTITVRESGTGASSVVYTAKNVVFGAVFVCSGQSNMELPVHAVDNAAEILANATNRPNIRLFSAPSEVDDSYPEPYEYHSQQLFYPDMYNLQWVVGNATTLDSFSAICYMAATEVMDLYTGDMPIGLISAAKGGTPVEGWGTTEVFETCQISSTLPIPIQNGAMNQSNSKVNVSSEMWSHPGTLFNQMIGPLVGISVNAVLWYQGEANMNEGYHLSRHNYFCLFRQMILAWRDAFQNPTLPFNFVQLHACDEGNNGQCFADFCNYGDIRMAQDDTVRYLDGVGMAVSYDHGHVGIHSPHKKEVGRRLGLKLLSTAFDQKVPEDGPSVVSACVKTPPSVVGDNNITAVTILLSNVESLRFVPTDECSSQSPLCCNGTQPGLPGTAYGIAQICLGDVWRGQQWYDATMSIGDDGHSVVFTADLGTDEHPWGQENMAVWQVRFAMGAFPSCALMNENGIPLAPFGPLAVSPACSFDQYARLYHHPK